MKKLENKTVFITGGLSGIGKACALAAAKEGANIVVADIRSDTTDVTMAPLEHLMLHLTMQVLEANHIK